ncbi:hypothetical protein F2Q68_00003828 [Brassica cretica]|uniref:Cysteine desulfurase n=1 Tax=Brassica cretica TaxID=69181 RepID=A0A8S9JFZ8_BRACR|nr:hypothetical protein F2Q68_00003828 [Brassica cretica]
MIRAIDEWWRLREGTSYCGTFATQQAVGLGVACDLAMKDIESMMRSGLRVAVSSTSASLEPSYVLRALGVDEAMAHTSIRFGIGKLSTEEEIDKAVRAYG